MHGAWPPVSLHPAARSQHHYTAKAVCFLQAIILLLVASSCLPCSHLIPLSSSAPVVPTPAGFVFFLFNLVNFPAVRRAIPSFYSFFGRGILYMYIGALSLDFSAQSLKLLQPYMKGNVPQNLQTVYNDIALSFSAGMLYVLIGLAYFALNWVPVSVPFPSPLLSVRGDIAVAEVMAVPASSAASSTGAAAAAGEAYGYTGHGYTGPMTHTVDGSSGYTSANAAVVDATGAGQKDFL